MTTAIQQALRTLVVCCALLLLHLIPHCHGLAPHHRARREDSAAGVALAPLEIRRRLQSIVPPSPSHRHQDDEDQDTLRRRIVILAAPAAALLLLPLPPPLLPNGGIIANAANAAETTTPSEAIRLFSSKNIPGLGPPDVYYPSYFVGRWRVTRIISNSDDDYYWNEMKMMNNGANPLFPVRVIHEMRFVPYDAGKDFVENGENGDNNGVSVVPAIADRSFNELSYHEALSKELDRLYNITTTKKLRPSIRSSNWIPSDPNVLSIVYDDGSSMEIKVTKRSCDVMKDGDGVFSSEFRRITYVPPSSSSSSGSIVGGGIPSIYKSRVLTKWKRGGGSVVGGGGGVNLIEGMEIVYNERGTLGDKKNAFDPLLGGGGGGGRNNNNNGAIPSMYGGDTKDLPDWRSTKTNILMERIM